MKKVTSSILIIITALFYVTGCSDSSTSADNESESASESVITLENSGASAYIAISIEGEGASAGINIENPEITLTTGGRYTFINNAGASSHPLDFRDLEGNKLFGQSRNDGSLENDPEIDVVKSENSITFTLTEDLADRLSDYICFFHPGMNGLFNIVDAG